MSLFFCAVVPPPFEYRLAGALTTGLFLLVVLAAVVVALQLRTLFRSNKRRPPHD